MDVKLKVWRENPGKEKGHFETYDAKNLNTEMSFLEMLDTVNEQLTEEGKEPIAFDHDCREGICGMCSLVINGIPHGPDRGVASCQVYMRNFKDGQTITIEPWRSTAFPLVRDLVVDRSAFDRIIQAGGYISVNTGNAPEANTIPVPRHKQEKAMDAAACIGCGACVAACPNASASLFVASKISHLAALPQGDVERRSRASRMIAKMDEEKFGSCSNHGECEAVCPKNISVSVIADMNREHLRSIVSHRT